MGDRISQLTGQQEILLSSYLRKWAKIALFHRHSNQNKNHAIEMVQDMYNLVKRSQPRILTLSEEEGLKALIHFDSKQLGEGMEQTLHEKLITDMQNQFQEQISEEVWKYLRNILRFDLIDEQLDSIEDRLWLKFEEAFTHKEWDLIQDKLWVDDSQKHMTDDGQPVAAAFRFNVLSSLVLASYCCLFDFCISELGCEYSHERWDVLTRFVNSSYSYLLPYQEICIAIQVSHGASRVLEDTDLDITIAREHSGWHSIVK